MRNDRRKEGEKWYKEPTIRIALQKALPIMGSYFFVSMAYGLVMQEAGFSWLWSFLISLTIYTGAYQFVLVTLLSTGASVVTIALTALLMNSRQFFYGLTFVEDFRTMGKRYPYMVATMTDETYAVNCAMLATTGALSEDNRKTIMFYVAIFCKSSWLIGSVLGGIAGQLVPVQLEGIDFCMTALFVTILIDQWKTSRIHLPAILGAGCGIGLLLLVGADRFMLPALLLVAGLLLLFESRIKKAEGGNAHE